MINNQTKFHVQKTGREIKEISLEEARGITSRVVSDIQSGRFSPEAFRQATGVHVNDRALMSEIAATQGLNKAASFAMDANYVPDVTTPSMSVPVQFLQSFLPGVICTLTAPRAADELMGLTIAGTFEDQEVVRMIKEPKGKVGEYGDYTAVPFTGTNVNFERRTVVRSEIGYQVGELEEAQMARVQISASNEKRFAALQSLEIMRNAIAFFGYYNGQNTTYGLLNDPNLLPYMSLPVGDWSTATFQQIQTDILAMITQLTSQTKGKFNAKTQSWSLAVPPSQATYLDRATDLGFSVTRWLNDNYPMHRVVLVPDFAGANGGDDAVYIFPDRVTDDGSTDDGAVVTQVIQTKMRSFNTVQMEKYFKTALGNATAGALVQRPAFVVRGSLAA